MDILSEDILLNLDISVEVITSKINASFEPNIETIFFDVSPLQQYIDVDVVDKFISLNVLYFLRRFCSGFL